MAWVDEGVCMCVCVWVWVWVWVWCVDVYFLGLDALVCGCVGVGGCVREREGER
jgi:hypothetical protein